MSAAFLIARHEWRRLAVQPFAWILAAVVVALVAWQFLLSLQGFIDLAPKLGGVKDAPGVTDIVATPRQGFRPGGQGARHWSFDSPRPRSIHCGGSLIPSAWSLAPVTRRSASSRTS